MMSPLSPQPPQKIRDLPCDFLLAELTAYFHSTPPPGIVETDYSLWRCAETGLEFCAPPLPGNVAFYEWVSSFPSYYPGFRWEYGEVSRLIRDEHSSNTGLEILDVGCGRGDFLRSLDFLPPGKKYALDLNEPAVQSCRAEGFKACCGTVDTALADGFLSAHQFPVVCSFHCLEHVGEPVPFVRELLRIVQPGGKLFLSTPYSPMSFESDWFDVMNHPPHHMTRWTLPAYRRLAELTGVQMRHFAPAAHPLRQALQKFELEIHGPNVRVPRLRRLAALAARLPRFLRTWTQISQRAGRHAIGGADCILVEFTAP
jgi:SAM-dependent methyltransferase